MYVYTRLLITTTTATTDGELARLLTPGDDQLTMTAGDDSGSVALSLVDQDCISLCSADTDISHTVAPHVVVQEY